MCSILHSLLSSNSQPLLSLLMHIHQLYLLLDVLYPVLLDWPDSLLLAEVILLLNVLCLVLTV